jgi:hypothetical protein
MNTVGITPRLENTLLAIDGNHNVGFDYTRNWQLRIVKDFGAWASFGLSLENPAELVYSGAGAVASGGNVGGWLVNYANADNSFLGSTAYLNPFAPDVAPDIIGKAALDPGWGHYEVFGIARFFNDNTFGCVVAPITTPAPQAGTGQTAGLCSTITANTLVPGQQSQRTKSGDGIGGSVQLPFTKYVDVLASTMYGSGIGRYGASLLPDVVVAPDGSLSPIKAFHALGGIVLHPWAGAGHLQLCWHGDGEAKLLEHRFHRLHQWSDWLWCSDRGQYWVQHHHRCLVHRRDFELRGHQQVGDRGHRGFLARLLQRQLWTGRRRVPVGIHPPAVIPRSGYPRGSSRLPRRGRLRLDLG